VISDTGEKQMQQRILTLLLLLTALNGFVSQSPAIAQSQPSEPTQLVGCPDKIRAKLGWTPGGTFRDLVHEMVEAELKREKARS